MGKHKYSLPKNYIARLMDFKLYLTLFENSVLNTIWNSKMNLDVFKNQYLPVSWKQSKITDEIHEKLDDRFGDIWDRDMVLLIPSRAVRSKIPRGF